MSESEETKTLRGAILLAFTFAMACLLLWCGTEERICLTNGGGPKCMHGPTVETIEEDAAK